jgi:hypothetical protein
MIYWIYENKIAENTEDFMDKCIAFFPFQITHILTDNGLDPRVKLEQAKQFTNRLLKTKTGNSCQKLSKNGCKMY